ncbi:MAG TPA: DUF5723 family protein [Longimicrobiales bacterium]|nr:DUF5723 family protein [Longimicrobiales bacterium]
MVIRNAALMLAVTAATAAPAAAQLPSGSTEALGMGNNFTAAARGFGALSWNPALLASSRNTQASMTLLTTMGGAGIGPIELSDIADYSDRLVPEPVKQDWLARVPAGGAERGTVNADLTWGAAQIGRFGLQVTSSVRTTADLSRDVLQLILFGNVDAEGDPANLDFAGSSLDLAAYTTFAGGYAHPFEILPGTRLLIGASAKYTLGHIVVTGDESRGTADASGFDIAFPIVNSVIDPDSFTLNNGGGFGFDVGAALETGPWTFAAAVENVVSTFEWDLEDLRYRPLSLEAGEAELIADTEEQPFDAAPESLREHVEQLGFKRSFSLGAAFRPGSNLLVSADLRHGGSDGIVTDATSHLGAGVEYRPISWLPLRAGAAAIQLGDDNTGFQIGGGLGLNLGGWNLSASALQRDTELFGGETMFMATIFATGLP